MIDKLKSHLHGDRWIWWIVVSLTLISMVTVYSSISNLAYRQAGGNTEAVIFRHGAFLGMGLLITFFTHKIDISKYTHIAKLLLFLSPILLLYTLFFGVSIDNASRWINVMGLSFQTSDFVKVVLIVNLAAMLASKIHIEYKPKDLIELIIWCSLIVLLLLQSGFSTAMLLGFTCFVVMWIGEVPGKYLRKMALAIVGVVILALLFSLAVKQITGKDFGRISTVQERTERFFKKNPDNHKNGGYKSGQETYAKVAIASGGIFGVGPGNSSQKTILPEAFSDYIYSIIIEEYGLFGGLVVLMLYLALLYRGIVNINLTERAFGGLLSVGLSLLLVFQAFAHIAVNVGLMPSTGQTLPIISRGGTSALFSYLALGIILGVSSNGTKKPTRS